MSFYAFKQLVGVTATPLMAAAILALVAVVLRLFAWRRTSAWIVVAAGAIAYLGSIQLVGAPLLSTLERRHAPLRDSVSLPAVQYVVVLGSDYYPRADLPVTSALDSEGVLRLAEGVRLLRRLPDATLVVSGGPLPGRGRPAAGYARLARELGVAEGSIVMLDRAIDTAGEARDVVAKLGRARFLLVTSAAHMPRAMLLMERVGARPIAAPVGVHYATPWRFRPRMLIPNGDSLSDIERALHEFLGLGAIALGLQRSP